MTGTPQRWEIALLIGPCSQDEAVALMEVVFEASGGALGAVASVGPWFEQDERLLCSHAVDELEAALAEAEDRAEAAECALTPLAEVEYGLENLRGWFPNGRGALPWLRHIELHVGRMRAALQRDAAAALAGRREALRAGSPRGEEGAGTIADARHEEPSSPDDEPPHGMSQDPVTSSDFPPGGAPEEPSRSQFPRPQMQEIGKSSDPPITETDRLGLRSGRGARPNGKCLIAQCPYTAGETIITCTVPYFGIVRGHVCDKHAGYARANTITGLSLGVEPLLLPARPE